MSSTSLESLDSARYALDDSLLAESLTLSSLSSSTSSTPPLPAGCMVPLSIIIGHQDGPVMLQSPLRKSSPATLTSPTPPRLRTMIKEKLLIETWLNGVDPEVAEHKPWSGIAIPEPLAWKSEGSLYAPQAFREKIAAARRSQGPEARFREPATETQTKRSTNRNALVFEREIILNTNGKSNRVSLHASASSMDEDVVQMITELQDLNSFFKRQDPPSSLPPPPSLIVSNSHFSLPVTFESPSKSIPKAALPLAARRGKMLPPVAISQRCEETEYPGMPTAFLGSPSTYSPKFEFASDPARSSMDLREMVTSLRSQCASIEPHEKPDARTIEVTPPTPEEEDEWAFADGLLSFYSPSPFESEFIKKPLRHDLVDYAAESLSSRPPSRAESINPLPSAPPSTPLPPCPSSQRISVRSILKSSKSVRFAEDVLDDDVVSPAVKVEPPIVRKPERHSAPTKTRSTAPRAARSTLHDPLRSPPPKTIPVLQSRAPRQRRATTPASFESSASSPRRPRACSTTTNTNTNANASINIGSPSKPAVPVGGRHSLGRVFAKENKEKDKGRWTLNENVLKRASVAGSMQPQKSRMPVPLRNILTRFK
ncbi:Methylenetetrahydrofolate reductase [Mycena kentingensis (nom. inval.)]|nr:Methylenetetrahydrofolate reductase [Mycena kentingensis (nom. inval.)]